MGGWVGPKFQHFGPPGTPPPRGVGALFLGFGFDQGYETCLDFSHIFHFFFILRQTCEPLVAHNCQNWLVAELVVALDSGFKVLGSNPSGGKILLVNSALLFHRFSCFGY